LAEISQSILITIFKVQSGVGLYDHPLLRKLWW